MKNEPNWISAKAMREWLGDISDDTERRLRESLNLHISKVGRTTMYDRSQIEKIITDNSTYSLLKTA